jgi:transcriptional regulator with XRE-family HTH domain
MARTKKPYATLGLHLKKTREQAKRSLEEVSGAVEIDEKYLMLIESGLKRPEEDVMLLLISYFNMADQEALHLWELADYDSDLAEHLDLNQADNIPDVQALSQMVAKPMLMLLSMDVRTMYSDGVEISWNEVGLTLNFTQKNSQPSKKANPQAISVSKVGMSYKQAEKVLECLEKALLHAKYNGPTKLLPPEAS